MHRSRWLLLALVVASAGVGLTGTAGAFVTTDVSWSLGPTTTTYGGGTQFHISQDGDDSVSYRWLDGDLTKTTVISGNNCSDFALLGKSTFGPGDTSYHTLFNGITSQCFVLRGRTDSGTTTQHNGRLRR